MLNNDIISIDCLLKNTQLKKACVTRLNQKIKTLSKAKKNSARSMCSFPLALCANSLWFMTENSFIRYVIDISFSKTNTLMHITDHLANLKYFCSAGTFSHKGKNKKIRYSVLKKFHEISLNKLKFLKNEPLALHLRNVGSNKSWIIKKWKKQFYIKLVRDFNTFPHNGCKRKKVKPRRNG